MQSLSKMFPFLPFPEPFMNDLRLFVAASILPVMLGVAFAADVPISPLHAEIRAALDAGAKTVRLTQPEYRFDAPLILEKVDGFEIDGNGARLVVTKPVSAIYLRNCSNVALKNFTIDYDPLPFTQGVITAVAPESKGFDFTIDEGYPDLIESYFLSMFHLFTADGRFWKSEAADMYGKTEILDARHGRFTNGQPEPALTVGDRVVVSYRSGVALGSWMCGGITYENITIHASPGAGILGRFGEGGDVLRRIVVGRGPTPPGAKVPRLFSTNADATNFAFLRKGPTLTDCDFSFQGDDSLNLHSATMPVAAVLSPTVFDTFCGYRGGQHHEVVRPGDVIRILDPVDYRVLSESTIKSFKRSPRTYSDEVIKKYFKLFNGVHGSTVYEIELEAAPSVSLEAGMFFDMPTIAAAGYEVRDSYFHDHRGRGLRFMAGDGVVRNNRLERIKNAAITVGAEYGFWREAGWVANIVISGNRVKDVGHGDGAKLRDQGYALGAISVFARLEDYTSDFKGNRNIDIVDNVIENCLDAGIFVFAADGVRIVGNRLMNTATARKAPGSENGFRDMKPIWIVNAANVVEEKNIVE